MRKQGIIFHLVLCLFFSLPAVGLAQTLPSEALNAVYRIQVVAVSDDKPLEAAEAFAKDFSAKFTFRAYVIHKDRWYKVLLGDFVTKREMSAGLKLVKKKSKDAWPVAPDNDKIVAIWEEGARVSLSQASSVSVTPPVSEVPEGKAVREQLPAAIASPEQDDTKQTPLDSDTAEATSAPELREQDLIPMVQDSEVIATPTPLPGVVEVDLLAPKIGPALPAEIAEAPIISLPESESTLVELPEEPAVIIPTPAPTVSLPLPDVSPQIEGRAVSPEKPEMSEVPLGETNIEDDELVIDIDDLQLHDVLADPQPVGELPLAELSPDLAARRAVPVLVKISPDDPRLAAVGFSDGALELWNLEARELRFRKSSHSGRICDLSFRVKTQHLASVSVDGSFKVWTVKDGSEQQSLRFEFSDIRDVKFDHVNARLLVLHQNRLTAFELSSRQQHPLFPAGDYLMLDERQIGERDRLVCPPKADAALAFDLDCCAPVLFQQLAGGAEIALPELFDTPLSAAAFSPSGNFFAIGRGKLVDFMPGEARVEVYQFLPSGKKQAFSVEFVLSVQAGLHDDVGSLAFSPKSSVLLAGHENGALQLFSLFAELPSRKNAKPELATRAGKVLRNFEGHSAAISGLAFFPDGKRVISVSHDGTMRVWAVESGKELERLDFE